jgi:hypothetical protein
MHCIGELIDPMPTWGGLEIGREHAVPRARDRPIMPSDPIAITRSASCMRTAASPSAPSVRRHRLHDVADEGLVAGARGREARRLVAAPHHLVGRRLDLGDLVAVRSFL